MESPYAIQLKGISKHFGKIIANNNISLSVKKGEILSLLGENGSGKTTLMNMLSGIYYPDSGQILVNGEEVDIRSPKDSFDLGIGMIHQHFKLIDVLTAAENIILGLQEKGRLNIRETAAKVKKIADLYGFDIDPNCKIYNMSVSEKQTVEIIKVLYRGADILILDEPTAVLTPQETEKLFSVLRNMKNQGKSIIIITHKLNEVMAISDRVAVLRKGEYIGTLNTAETTVNELTSMMVGKSISLDIEHPEVTDRVLRLEVKDLTCINSEGVKTLDNVSFSAYGGEILGVAGIAGSGQKELLESIAGLQLTAKTSDITYYPKNKDKQKIIGKTPAEIARMGITLSFVPEDRLGMGLVSNMDLTGNMMLKSYKNGNSVFTNPKPSQQLASEIIKELEIVTPNLETPVAQLSGGNVQKVLLGREISASPTVLMVAYPVRGLDINSSYMIYHLLNEQKKRGAAVIYVGEDLDVLLELCDRILVLCDGLVSGIVDAAEVNKEDIGLLMTSHSIREEAAL